MDLSSQTGLADPSAAPEDRETAETPFVFPPPQEPDFPGAERWLGILLLLGGLGLRLLYIWHYRIDSDEPQHLHVVWAWANGLLPYRDVFDNHSPVFQALCAPLFHLLGVRADILQPMRAAMLPLFGLTIYSVWKIGTVLFTRRTAFWTAILTAFFPPFFFTSVEFRPDELWTLVWLVTLAVLVSGEITWRRVFTAGLLLGLAFSVSMKSTLFLVTLVLAFGGTLLARRAMSKDRIDRGLLLRCTGAGLLGMVVIPALVVLYFALNGAGREMFYCIIQHNMLPGASHAGALFRATWHWLLWMPLAFAGCSVITRLPSTVAIRARTTFVFLAAVLFYTTLDCYWPILTAEDYLPFFPVLMITAAPLALWLGSWATQWLKLPRLIVPLLLAGGEVTAIVATQSPFKNQTTDKIGMVADTLKLTDPTDFVMDSKGETIFRRRPSYYVMEGLTYRRFVRGLLEDDIAARLIATRAPLATTRRMPPTAREFIKNNYVPIAFRLRVLGKLLPTPEGKPDAAISFELSIPALYTIVTPSGLAAGSLDGAPFTGPRFLDAGHHEFRPEERQAKMILVWAQAVERGYSPFAEIKADYNTPQD